MAVEGITLRTPAEVRALLEGVGTPGPSLHPHVGSEDLWKRWNGWNKTFLVGVDAEGRPFMADLWVYADGGSNLAAGLVGNIPFGSVRDEDFTARTGIVFPVVVFPPLSVILHPEHTPATREGKA